MSIAWQNPHPRFELEVTQRDGSTVTWRIEVRGALGHLRRAGVAGELVAQGQAVKIAGFQSMRRELALMATNMLLPDGLEVLLSEFDDPRWSENYVGGAQGWALKDSVRSPVGESDKTLFQVWSIPNRNEHGRAYGSLLSPMLAEARKSATTEAEYNRMALDCEPYSMPYVMVLPEPIWFIDNGDTLALRIGIFDTVRTIHMSAPERPNEPASPLGYSIGRWDGGDLIIETSQIEAPHASVIGVAQSPDMKVVERYSLSDDGTALRLRMTLEDARIFSRPATYELEYLALNEQLEAYDCRPQ